MATRIPGFIDLQVNGYLGTEFSELSLTTESFVSACAAMLASGSAGMLATVVTAPQAVYERNLPIIAAALERPVALVCWIDLVLVFIGPLISLKGS